MLADRIQRIGTSATLRISAKAKAMKAEGIDVIDLSVGEPDFPTPYNIKEAAKRAIDENFTKYTLNAGMLELRQAICRELSRTHGLEYAPEQVIVSCGAKQSLANLCTALLNKGAKLNHSYRVLSNIVFKETQAMLGKLIIKSLFVFRGVAAHQEFTRRDAY